MEEGDAQRTIIIAKMLHEPQRNAELASGALVSSAPSSSDTGSRVIPQIPMRAERTNKAAVLFGRTISVGYQVRVVCIRRENWGTCRPRSGKAKPLTLWEQVFEWCGPGVS